ncbi:MAG TPA: D-2-hydroxyacid dehydrogenase [Terriglobales bacterium]
MKLVIAVPHPFPLWRVPEWFVPRLEHEFAGLNAVNVASFEEMPAALADADVLVTYSLREGQLAQARKLRWIHSTMAGVGPVLTPEVVSRDIVVTNASEVHGGAVAEHAFALLLALAKQLNRARDMQHEHHWGLDALLADGPVPRTVVGATLVLIGLGAIGRRVAAMAKAFEMRVIGVRQDPARGMANTDRVVGFDQIDEVLPEADFVALAAPVTEITRHMMNADRLALLKPSAYLINVARGALVDEAALSDALREKRIAGAALDVFTEEPLPENSELWRLRNVIITPHSAGLNAKLWDLQYEVLAENLRRFRAGEPLLNVVNKVRGY